MGTCAGNYKPEPLVGPEADLGLYKEVLKCPSDHWLAVYTTEKCTKCLQKDILTPGTVSCIDCEFSLCESCFSKKFSQWERKALRLNPEEAEKLLASMKQEIEDVKVLIANSP